MAAVDVIDHYLAALPGAARRVADAEWGVTLPAQTAGGEPLDVGVPIAGGLVTAKAAALGPAPDLDPWMLLSAGGVTPAGGTPRSDRQTRHVRFGCSRSREIWVHADFPAGAVDERSLDRLLGLVAEGAIAVRDYARRVRQAASGPP